MKKRALGLMLCICMSIGTLAGCSSGVSQAEYDKVVAERDALAQQLQEMQNSTADSTTNNTVNVPDDLEGKITAYLDECPLEIKSLVLDGKYYYFLVENKSNKHIISAEWATYFYDADYLPLSTFYRAFHNETLKAGETEKRSVFSLTDEREGAVNMAIVMTEAEFSDGSVWENKYFIDINNVYELQASADYALIKSLDEWMQ